MALKLQTPWYLRDLEAAAFVRDLPVPDEFTALAGPRGLALVRLWPNGTTSRGWGLHTKDGSDGFMPRYLRGEFNSRRVIYGYERDRWAFAFVMRSLNVVAIDIDGKNDGLRHAEELLAGASPTLAETSKSGTGLHLFYRTDEAWDSETGFGHGIGDHIGIVQGVDIRATGCIYHHKSQRWNERELAPLPDHIAERLAHKTERRIAARSLAETLHELEETEVLMLHDNLLTELAKPIKVGERNNTLFAIGAKMKAAGVEGWDDLLRDRAYEVGLPDDEVEKLVSNIETYG